MTHRSFGICMIGTESEIYIRIRRMVNCAFRKTEIGKFRVDRVTVQVMLSEMHALLYFYCEPCSKSSSDE
jgi:hypothetical protein